MKQKFLNYSMSLVTKYNPNYDKNSLLEIKYGLELLYISITKMIIICVLAYFLGILKEMLIIVVSYNLIRPTAFGLHANKGWQCLIVTSFMFLIFPFLSRYLVIPITIKTIILMLCFIGIVMYAPADTPKHPLIKKERRKKYKIISCITTLILSFLVLYFDKNLISNLILSSIIMQVILLLPITYRLMGVRYNNYKYYKSGLKN